MSMELFSRWRGISCHVPRILLCPARCQPVLCCLRHCVTSCVHREAQMSPLLKGRACTSLSGPFKSYIGILFIVFIAFTYYQSLSCLFIASLQVGRVLACFFTMVFQVPRIMLSTQEAVHNYLLNERISQRMKT